jgi:hypothetical protein
MEIFTGLAELCAYFLRGGKKMKIYLTAELLGTKFSSLKLNKKLYLCKKI